MMLKKVMVCGGVIQILYGNIFKIVIYNNKLYNKNICLEL
jgi:hypothetical protein